MLKAVVFDYGLVLSGPRAQWAIDDALKLTGLGRERFEEVYWKFRERYDVGSLSGAAYWHLSLEDAGMAPAPALVAELVRLDGAMWCTQNAELAAWLPRLRAAGTNTAILSNMGDAVRAAIEQNCPWVHACNVRVWSHDVGFTKPDVRIYNHTVNRLGLETAEVLFLDDRIENVEAARRCGMHALVFSTVDQLRRDLGKSRLLSELPPL